VNRADRDYAIGRGLAAVRADGCDPDFLHHALQRWRWCLQRVAQGTTFDAVTARHFAQLRVAVPREQREQAAIARILDAVDTALEGTRAAVERAREVKRAVLQRFFYDALGETAYADRPRRKLPPGWSLVATDLLLAEEPKNGVSPEASSHPPGTPTFSIAAIRDGRVDLNNRDNLKYTRVSETVARRFCVQHGDFLIVRGNANPDLVGKAGMVSEFPEGCIYPDIAKRVVFRTDPEPKVSPEFAVLAWNHAIVHNQVLRRAKTSNGTLKINNRDVKQIVMSVPPEKEQAQLVKIVASVDAQIDALTAVSVAEERLKRALMHDLLTGRVRVSNEAKAAAS
jgi:type I restriction enzyme S subunit